jgi:hypothetical protein
VRVGMTSVEAIDIMGEPTDKWAYFLNDGALVWVSAADTTAFERTFSWFGNYRRLVVRWDRSITIYRAFFHVACMMITLRQF